MTTACMIYIDPLNGLDFRPCLVKKNANFGTMQKEDSPSHQTSGTCMEY